jgi:hypothetical protein
MHAPPCVRVEGETGGLASFLSSGTEFVISLFN